MKILFIGGSLEPGRDGVGDYSRRLAGELIRQGHDCRLVAINDPYLAPDDRGDRTQEQDGIRVLRLPKTLSWRQRIRSVREWTEAFSPDWMSLQFVGYSFHPKGIPHGLGSHLKRISPRSKWHIMFHEPYIGYGNTPKAGGLKSRLMLILLRRLQIIAIKGLHASLSPGVVHTSTAHYQTLLQLVNIKSNILDLFGAIPVSQINIEDDSHLTDTATGVYFGTAPPSDAQTRIASELLRACTYHKKRLKIVLCGRQGADGVSFYQALDAVRAVCGLDIEVRGEMTVSELSLLFKQADFGVARTPARLLGKSSASIAMLEHGLPLWIPLAESGTAEAPPDGCYPNLLELLQTARRGGCEERLPRVAAEFAMQITRMPKSSITQSRHSE